MNRRSCLTAMLAGFAGMKAVRAQAPAKNPIVLFCDLPVDPKREEEMLNNFHTIFKPAAEKFEGFIDLKMLKLRTTYSGTAPEAGVNYRFQLTYQTEELRQAWAKSAIHQKVWPTIENTLTSKRYQTLLFDSK
jgi:hypothetical protein